MVAADEPRAVTIGRDVLTAGGTAADAAVAMAFTMAVTLPTQVGLGSAGSCLAYNHDKSTVNAIDFVPPANAGGTGSLLPIMPRAMFLLHANNGSVPWNQLVQPVQALAQRGVPASRAFIRQFTPVAETVLADPVARTVFARPDGQPLAEGDLLQNPQLGTVLGRIGSRGVGELYNGTWAQEFTDAAHQAGATFSANALRDVTPQTHQPLAVAYGHEMAYFAPPPAALGALEQAAWAGLAGADAYSAASKENKARTVDDALAAAPTPSADQTAGASLVAVDGNGNAVTCAFTLNGVFGTGHMVPGFGTYLAATTPDAGAGLGPMLTINPNSNEFRFAAAASGGIAGAKMIIRTALRVLEDEKPLPDAIAEGAKADGVDRIQAARCLSGSPDTKRCVAVTDPRGFGLAQTMAGQ
ncbi:MAG TPA: gamma-glutamyltransferase [Magnetospirillaceae bacterium]